MASEPEFDVVVVGSGASGGWAAMRLTRAGLRVAVVEVGQALDPEKDFRDHTPPEQVPLRGKHLPREVRRAHPVQSTSYAFSGHTHHVFIDDAQNPYSTPPDKPFVWIRNRVVGGRTQVWGRVALRFSPLDLAAGRRDGLSPDWPLTYDELAPYYDEVERFIGVTGMKEGLAQLPDGQFLPPMQLSCAERLLRARAAPLGRTVTLSRAAVLTTPLPGRAPCHSCGPCERGCITRSYFSSPGSTLPAAAQTGRLTLLTGQRVRHVTVDEKGRARGVLLVDTQTRAERELRGRVVVLCASTLESTRILLNSRTLHAPQGLGNGSGMLGRHLMDHVASFLGLWTFPELRGVADAPGYRPTGFYVPRFRNLGKTPERLPFARGYGIQGFARETGPYSHAYGALGHGADFKRRVRAREGAEWVMPLIGFGECLPRPQNHCRIDPDRVDAWGIPTLHIDMEWSDHERAMVRDMAETTGALAEAAGARPASAFAPELGPPGAAVHECGTARMGDDPRTSVLNRWNQCHEVPNLFVMDGASFPSSPCQNPTLTIMALAARASDHLVAELKRRNL